MDPKDFERVCALIEAAARAAYTVGREDERDGNPVKDSELLIDAGRKLLLQKMMKARKKR